MIGTPDIHYGLTSVGPSKLELFLAQAPELTDEQKEKVVIITDIVKLATLLGYDIPTTEEFYRMYSLTKLMLEAKQYNLQIEWNTRKHHADAGTTPPTWGISS